MSLPDFLCHRTIRWLADQQSKVAVRLDEYIADHKEDPLRDFELLARAAHNRSTNLSGLAITVARRKQQ